MMNATTLLNALTRAEVNGRNAPDARRVIRGERETLSAALKSKDPARIAAAMEEARRVAEMWGIGL